MYFFTLFASIVLDVFKYISSNLTKRRIKILKPLDVNK